WPSRSVTSTACSIGMNRTAKGSSPTTPSCAPACGGRGRHERADAAGERGLPAGPRRQRALVLGNLQPVAARAVPRRRRGTPAPARVRPRPRPARCPAAAGPARVGPEEPGRPGGLLAHGPAGAAAGVVGGRGHAPLRALPAGGLRRLAVALVGRPALRRL